MTPRRAVLIAQNVFQIGDMAAKMEDGRLLIACRGFQITISNPQDDEACIAILEAFADYVSIREPADVIALAQAQAAGGVQ